MSKKKSDETDEVSFEKALARLETIVEEMESGTLSLEDMMARFEEGQKLVKLCSTKLNQVERRIEILVKEGDSVTPEKFEEADESPASRPEKPDDGLPF
ncbi:MAG: exodeoxyribonuclease VII small subunit [bacterium]